MSPDLNLVPAVPHSNKTNPIHQSPTSWLTLAHAFSFFIPVLIKRELLCLLNGGDVGIKVQVSPLSLHFQCI